MNVRFFSILTTIAVLGSPALMAQAPSADAAPAVPQPELKREFEGLYLGWRDAMSQKDYNRWQRSTSSYRQAQTRNEVISQRLRFPDALFAVPVQAPDVSNLLHVAVLARGDAATSVYFGKADFGVGEAAAVTDNFIVLRFLREHGVWLFDNLRVVKFGNDPEMLLKISGQDFSFLESPEFQPPAEIPKVPGPVTAPDFLAEVWVTSVGFETTIEVNNQHSSKIANDTGRRLIIGGLKRGANRLKVTTRPAPLDTGTPKYLEVAIYAAAKPEEEAKRVFHYRPGPGQMPEVYEATVEVAP